MVGHLFSCAVLLVKAHASQNLQHSLVSLAACKGLFSELYLLFGSGCTPTSTESAYLGQMGVVVHTREIDPLKFSEAVNSVVPALRSDSLAFLKAGDALSVDFFHELQESISNNPLGVIFWAEGGYPDGRSVGQLGAAEFKPSWNHAEPCVLSGLAVNRAWFVSAGGFHTGCQVRPEMELWFRVFLVSPSRLVQIKGATTQLLRSTSEWVLRFGARQVLEMTSLVRRLTGWCSAVEFLDYANEITLQVQLNKEQAEGVASHLQDLAQHIAFMVHPSERGDLQRFLSFSVVVPSSSPEFRAVDDAFLRHTNGDLSDLPNPFETEFFIHSLGSFCQAASVLKDLALRRRTGPFDWIFSNAAAASHMLDDRFKVFLDNQFHHEVAAADKVDPHSNACDHLYYKEKFGVKFLFNHHKPFEEKDGKFFRDAVQGFISDLDGDKPCLLLHIARISGPAEDYERLWHSLSSYVAKKHLIVVKFVRIKAEPFLDQAIGISSLLEGNITLIDLPVVSETNGTLFSDNRDNRRFRRVVYSACQLALRDLCRGDS